MEQLEQEAFANMNEQEVMHFSQTLASDERQLKECRQKGRLKWENYLNL